MRYLLFYLLFFSFVQAEEIRGIIRPSDTGISNLKEGDIFDAKIYIWPIKKDEENLKFFDSYEGNFFLSNFYVVRVQNKSFSVNNEEVLDIDAILVLNKDIKENIQEFKLGDKLVKFEIKSISSKTTPMDTKKFILWDQNIKPYKKSNYLFYLLIGLLLIGTVFLFFKIKSKKANNYDSTKNLWKEKFYKAKNRNDFEYIYFMRKSWMPFIKEKEANLFFKVLNNLQYRKSWTKDNLLEVQKKFNLLKRSFE